MINSPVASCEVVYLTWHLVHSYLPLERERIGELLREREEGRERTITIILSSPSI